MARHRRGHGPRDWSSTAQPRSRSAAGDDGADTIDEHRPVAVHSQQQPSRVSASQARDQKDNHAAASRQFAARHANVSRQFAVKHPPADPEAHRDPYGGDIQH
jgi:hypothetical protein